MTSPSNDPCAKYTTSGVLNVGAMFEDGLTLIECVVESVGNISSILHPATVKRLQNILAKVNTTGKEPVTLPQPKSTAK